MGEHERGSTGAAGGTVATDARGAAPGKRTRTMGLPAGDGGGDAAGDAPGDSAGDGAPIQRAGDGNSATTARHLDESVRPDLYCAPAGGAGRALEPGVKTGMEGAFNADFSAVRVHEGGAAPAVGALAYTQGADLHFAPGQYNPGSTRGRELIGHELAHVVQQAEGRVSTPAQAKGAAINADPGLEAEADDLGSRAARGEQVRGGATVTAGPSGGGIQRYAFINGTQIAARDPAHSAPQTAFVTDTRVRDYQSTAEFANHAAGTTDYLGNLASDGTWMRFNPAGINLLGENHTMVRLDHVAPAVGSTNFIYERLSNDAMTPGSHMEGSYQTENAGTIATMGITGRPNQQNYGAESLYPKIGYGMALGLPHLSNAAGVTHLRPPIYDGQPVQRYFKIGWGYSEDNVATVAAQRAGGQAVAPQAAHLATVHAAVAGLLGPFLTGLPVDGWLGDGLAAAANQAALLPALRQFAQAMIEAITERALTDPTARLTPAQQTQFGAGGHATNAQRQAMFSAWRDFNFEDSVRSATGRGVRYAGMGRNHLTHLQGIGLTANQHPYDMAATDLNNFRTHTNTLRAAAHPVP